MQDDLTPQDRVRLKDEYTLEQALNKVLHLVNNKIDRRLLKNWYQRDSRIH